MFAFQIINNAIFGIVLIVPKLANYRIIYREIDKDKVSGNFSYPVLLLSTNLDGQSHVEEKRDPRVEWRRIVLDWFTRSAESVAEKEVASS